MAAGHAETAVTWDTGSASKAVSSATVAWSDVITLNANDVAGTISVNADNGGTPASGDTCDVYVGWTNGDILGDSGDDYDSVEHSEFVGRLDTYSSNTPGEDPARATWPLSCVPGAKGLRIGVSCPQAASRTITVRARLGTYRAA